MSAPEASGTTSPQGKGKHKASLPEQDTPSLEWRPEPNAFNTGHMQARRSSKGTKRPMSKDVDTSREQNYKSGFADRKEKQPNFDAQSSRARDSACKDVTSDSEESRAYKTHANETKMERRVRIKKEWEEK